MKGRNDLAGMMAAALALAVIAGVAVAAPLGTRELRTARGVPRTLQFTACLTQAPSVPGLASKSVLTEGALAAAAAQAAEQEDPAEAQAGCQTLTFVTRNTGQVPPGGADGDLLDLPDSTLSIGGDGRYVFTLAANGEGEPYSVEHRLGREHVGRRHEAVHPRRGGRLHPAWREIGRRRFLPAANPPREATCPRRRPPGERRPLNRHARFCVTRSAKNPGLRYASLVDKAGRLRGAYDSKDDERID